MEQLVVILVFAICAAACVRIFVGSYLMAGNSRDLKNALQLAETMIECYKATSGDLEQVGEILNAPVPEYSTAGVQFFFAADLLPCSGRSTAAYILSIVERNEDSTATLRVSDLLVSDREGNQLISLEVAVRMGR